MNGDAGFDIDRERPRRRPTTVSTLKIENGRVRYDRINAPFNLSIGTPRSSSSTRSAATTR